MNKRVVVLAMCILVLSTVVVAPVSAAKPLTILQFDITGTTIGTQVAQEAVQRWIARGWVLDCDCSYEDLRVYEINPDDYLIAPASAEIELIRVRQPDRSVKLEPRILTVTVSPSDFSLEGEDVSPMSAQYWGLLFAHCFARYEGARGWIDHCYHLHRTFRSG